MIGTAISSDECEALLRDSYCQWEIQKLDFSRFSQRLLRGTQQIGWSANYCLLVARRPRE